MVLDPKTGAVLAMYSNPNYNPVPLTSPNIDVETAARHLYFKPDKNGFAPLGLVATQETFPPGSTFKVITTAAAVVSKPADLIEDFNSTVRRRVHEAAGLGQSALQQRRPALRR